MNLSKLEQSGHWLASLLCSLLSLAVLCSTRFSGVGKILCFSVSSCRYIVCAVFVERVMLATLFCLINA